MKHGYDCDTEIYIQSDDIEYVTREALRFSRAYDIVNSDLWANLQEENGIDGWTKGNPNPHSEKWNENIGKANKGKIISQKQREQISKKLTGVPRPDLKGRKRSKEFCKDISKRFAKTWLVTSPNGDKQIIENLNVFCKENNIHQAGMWRVATGEYKQHKGWRCERIDNG